MLGKIVSLIVCIALFSFGLYLNSQGLPADEGEASLLVASEIVKSTQNPSDSLVVKDIKNNSLEGLRTLGFWLTVASVVAFVFDILLIWDEIKNRS
ncbi:hypothetical protein HYT57_02015 [Candidatus Woesearchaeota archaeon]|nr:hypothetical protein [Candidatus Woesearchaeota archaeon]